MMRPDSHGKWLIDCKKEEQQLGSVVVYYARHRRGFLFADLICVPFSYSFRLLMHVGDLIAAFGGLINWCDLI